MKVESILRLFVHRRTVHILCCMIVPLTVVASTYAQVAGISYTLTPMAERVYFDKNSGLADGTFFGARLGFGFGEYAELSGLYLVSTGLGTDFSRFSDLGGEYRDAFDMLPSREVSTRQYGANLKFNLGRSTIFPFVSVGTGILEFDPENLDKSRVIYLTGAAGLQFGLSDHFGLLVQVQDLVYRYTPSNVLLSDADLADLGLMSTDFRQLNVNNFAVRVGLQIYAGGRVRGELTDVDRALREQFSGGLSGIRLQVEPIGGVIDFDEDLGYTNHQRMAGILAGIDLGSYLGLRGFYLRGVEEDAFTDFDNLQAYGGEVKLKFGTVMRRVIPHVVLGGGYLDVLSGYEGNGVMQPVDRPFAFGGAGFTLPLTGAIQLHGGVRALLLTTEDVESVSDPSEISTNLFYTAGISFGLGGGNGAGGSRPPLVSPADSRALTAEAELERARRQIDSLQISLRRARGLDAGVYTPDPDAEMLSEPGTTESRWITVPTPERGELYIRYGEAGGPPSTGVASNRVIYVDPTTGEVVGVRDSAETVGAAGESLTADDIQAIVRDAVRRELQSSGRDEVVLFEDDVSATERRLHDRITELEERIAARQTDSRTVIVRDDVDRVGGFGRSAYELNALIPFAGVGFSGEQIGMAGLRADIRSNSLAGARFMPELVTAVGTDGLSYAINGDVAFPLGFQVASFRPYAGLGLGLVTADGAELVFNLLAGAEHAGLYGRFFAEYMSQDFFDLNRIVVGYRLSF